MSDSVIGMTSPPQNTGNQPLLTPKAIAMDKDNDQDALRRGIIFQPIATKKVTHDVLKHNDEVQGVLSPQDKSSKDEIQRVLPPQDDASKDKIKRVTPQDHPFKDKFQGVAPSRDNSSEDEFHEVASLQDNSSEDEFHEVAPPQDNSSQAEIQEVVSSQENVSRDEVQGKAPSQDKESKAKIHGVVLPPDNASKDEIQEAVPPHNTAPLTSEDIEHEMNILDTELLANEAAEHEINSAHTAPLMENDVVSNNMPIQNATPLVNKEMMENERPSLDPALRSFMVKKAYEYTDPAKWKGILELEDATLCDVLELDEDAIATMDLKDRELIFTEAKLNIGRWDDITPYQRTDVNLTIARMKLHEVAEENEEYLNNLPREKRVAYFMEINSNLGEYGHYEAVEFKDIIGQRDVRFEWVSNYARKCELGRLSRMDLDFEQYYGFILELAAREMGWFKNEQDLFQLRLCNLPEVTPEEFLADVLGYERIHLQRGCEAKYCETLARAKFIKESEAMKQQSGSEESSDSSSSLESIHVDALTESLINTRHPLYEAELIREEVDEMIEQNQVTPRRSTISLRPYYLPDGKVAHLPSSSGHRYPLVKCKLTVNGNDINESLGKCNPAWHMQDLEEAADGTGLVGNWLMDFYYEDDVDDF